MAGKYHTICSAPTREQLERMINQYYLSENYVIHDDLSVENLKTGYRPECTVRFTRGRWFYTRPK